MKNIERFNIYAAHIFGTLYVEFPVPRMLHAREVFDAVEHALDLAPDEKVKQHKFFSWTMRWLQETGYVTAYGEGENRSFVLAPRAFEAMNADLPLALRCDKVQGEVEEYKSVGDKLVEVATDTGKDIARETRKQVASQLVGQVIGHVIKAFSTQ